jgi:uncharacterized repeat protein (TIGR01451 family)
VPTSTPPAPALFYAAAGAPAPTTGILASSRAASSSHFSYPFSYRSGAIPSKPHGCAFLACFCGLFHYTKTLLKREFSIVVRIMYGEPKIMEKPMNSFRNSFKRIAMYLLLLGALSANTAIAQQGNVQVEHKAEQRQSFIDENGVEQTRMTEATRVIPGEEIFFTVTYRNSGDEPAENITVTNPVPNNMDYVNGSASGDNTTIIFSVVGGNNFDTPQNLTVTDTEGSQKPASAVDYTHIRWTVEGDIAPDASGTVQFSAVVE